jgi:hypothetical protein
MDESQAVEQEEILRGQLRDLGLGWLLEQVDESLVNEAAEVAEPPDARRRLEVIVDAVAFAVEVTEEAEGSLFPLLAGEPLPGEEMPPPAERPPDVHAIRFIDPVAREAAREATRDRGDRARRAQSVRDAAEQLKREVRR